MPSCLLLAPLACLSSPCPREACVGSMNAWRGARGCQHTGSEAPPEAAQVPLTCQQAPGTTGSNGEMWLSGCLVSPPLWWAKPWVGAVRIPQAAAKRESKRPHLQGTDPSTPDTWTPRVQGMGPRACDRPVRAITGSWVNTDPSVRALGSHKSLWCGQVSFIVGLGPEHLLRSRDVQPGLTRAAAPSTQPVQPLLFHPLVLGQWLHINWGGLVSALCAALLDAVCMGPSEPSWLCATQQLRNS